MVALTPTTPGIAERAVHAARAHRAADPDGFHHRHDNREAWDRWTRRARVARTIAAALQVPVDAVLVTDDPHRTYPTRNGEVPADLISVTDPATGHEWRFIPDHTTPGQAWLLLDRCPGCPAEFTAARIATLADLGDYLDPDHNAPPGTRVTDTPDHQPDCASAAITNLRSATRPRHLRHAHPTSGDQR